MTYKIIGTCSLCGGDVVEPSNEFSFRRCVTCDAVESSGLPVIPMRKSTGDIVSELLLELETA